LSERVFEFGANWRRFLRHLSAERIQGAEESLRARLGLERLEGKTFLDVGCGSGLFSLAARRLGARVHSFDVDPESVACARELRARFFSSDPDWVVEPGSALDGSYLAALGAFDVVYSWGVLHHTGAMWEALANIAGLVAPGGSLFLAIYNDQGWRSGYWRAVKSVANRGPVGRWSMVALHAPYLLGGRWLARALTGRGVLERGMSLWHDMIDWVGGFPTEMAKPELVFDFFRARGFELRRLGTCGGRHGCNEFVFSRPDPAIRAGDAG
jgi:2-polyprenyl-6-hydroxyphenyl methylase/3-demethylubiquinone-9 3-methyltransferase